MSTITFHPTDPLTWKQADDDVYVATRAGEFAGFVEFDGDAHLVQDGRGIAVGSFPTLGDARRALEDAGRAPRRGARLGVPIWRRMLRRARA